jgi:hypothetical protein
MIYYWRAFKCFLFKHKFVPFNDYFVRCEKCDEIKKASRKDA